MCVCPSPSQEAELQRLAKAREAELGYKKELDRLEVEKQERLVQLESQRFKQMMESLGSDTLKEIARSGPELQVGFSRPGARSQSGTGPVFTGCCWLRCR